MAPFMRHISLIRWIAEENDYETRFIGDAHVQAYGETSPAGHRMSTMIAERPEFGNMLRSSYDMARMRRAPLIIRGFIGTNFPMRGLSGSRRSICRSAVMATTSSS